MCTLLFICYYNTIAAQAFEGLLQIDYRGIAGNRSAVDVYTKGNKFYIKKVYGGPDRYYGYILDTKMRTLCCLSSQSPRTALIMDIDKVLNIYERKQLKPAFQIHTNYRFDTTSVSKKIGGINALKKTLTTDSTAIEIWISNLDINYNDLLPVLRVIGCWGDAEDDNNCILESKITLKRNGKASTTSTSAVKSKVDDSIFVIPDSYQIIDLDKFLVNEYKSTRFGELVKAFTGF